MSLATSTDKRAWCRRIPRQSTFHISPLVARWANEVESHDRLPSAQVGQGRSAHHKTSNRSGSPISIECRARISARALGSIRENVVRSIISDSAPLPTPCTAAESTGAAATGEKRKKARWCEKREALSSSQARKVAATPNISAMPPAINPW